MPIKKASMNVVDVLAWVNTSGREAIDSRVVNIYSMNDSWIFKLLTSTGRKMLKAEPGRRVNFSIAESTVHEVSGITPVLRRHLRRGLIKAVGMLDFDRVAYIDIVRGDRSYRLYIELLPRGVLALTTNEVIIASSKSVELKDRVIRPGVKYSPPPEQLNPLEASLSELRESLSKGRDLIRGLIYGFKLPGEVAEEVLYRVGLIDYKTMDSGSISEKIVESIVEGLRELVNESLRGEGYLVKSNEELVSFSPYSPKLFEELHKLSIVRVSDFNTALDSYFTALEREKAVEEERRAIEGEVAKILKSIEEQEKLIEEYLSKASMYKAYFENLALNINEVREVINCIEEERARGSWSYITKCSGVVSYNKDSGLVNIKTPGGVEVPIDVRLNADENVNNYYRLYGEYLGKVERAKKAVEELRAKLLSLQGSIESRARAVAKSIKPKYWYERFHWMMTSEGLLVIAGRNADQNEAIVRKYMEPRDVFMHADIHGAPVTLIKVRGRGGFERSIREAAVIAACYSKAWSIGFSEIDVYWVLGEQVSKTPPSGEYLEKGSFMIYGRKNYVKHVALNIALGVEEVYDSLYGTYRRVIVGPEEVVRERSLAYGVIAPGSVDSNTVAKELTESFSKMLREDVGVSLSEVAERLPGPSRILKIVGGASP
ncbi:MAG: ribosome rescue protein RqcH [Desulfurococcaceae archaeon]|nr:NFACT family protein [Sulfolobales archaeon]MDW8170690.1 ribosome rescue protein RqcH [Desulfurococcaceae archaeon]